MARFVQMLRRRHPGGAVAVVSHADPLSALRLDLLGKELTHANLRQEAPPLGSVFAVELPLEGSPHLDWFWKPPTPTATPGPPGEPGRDGVEAIAGQDQPH
jgi:broad specificity phosphatase PhoE